MYKSEIHIIIQKLDDFIKKYYRNQFLKGIVFYIVIFTVYFVSISSIEYFTFLPIITRTIVFYFSLIASLITFYVYIALPLLHMLRKGKVLSYFEATKIIEKYFPEIKDTLKNSLELSNNTSISNNDLVVAAINQKIVKLNPIPFSSVFEYNKFFSFLKYPLLFFILVIILVFLYPKAILHGANRIIHHSTYYEKPAPFSFILKNKSLQVVKGEDYTIKLEIQGQFVPNEVDVVIAGNSFIMNKISNSTFEYTIQGCNNTIDFFFNAQEYRSALYNLNVNPLPQILNFEIVTDIPKYTGVQNFKVTNTGDISVPEGTKLTWNVSAVDADNLEMYNYKNKTFLQFKQLHDKFMLNATAMKTFKYSFVGSNNSFTKQKIIDYTISVIPDALPAIEVESKKDSTSFYNLYFKGLIQDDYGFTNLYFVYFNESNPKIKHKVPIQIIPSVLKQDFYFMFDFSRFEKGQSITYYFEIFDNDAINGKKSTKTSLHEFKSPSFKELENLHEKATESVENTANQSMSISKELLKDISNLQKKMLQENLSDWERKELLDEIKEKQNELKQQVSEMNKVLQQKNDLQQKLSDSDKQLLEKQKQIEDLLKNIMDDELKKLFEDFNKLMNSLNKEDFLKKSDDMKMSYEELSKQMDRDLELLKRMDVEQKIKNTASKLDDLSKKQDQLSNDVQKNKMNQDELLKQQNQIQKDFNDIQNSFDNAVEKNNELQNKLSIDEFKEQFNQIQNSMNQSKQQLQNKQMNKSSKSMQNSSDQMQQLSDKMEQMINEQMKEQNMEDIDNLRQILDNLLTFSFEQEALMGQTNKLSYSDPKYPNITFKQNALRSNFDIIRDSLYSLSLRAPQISSEINSELFTIQKKLDNIISYLENQQRSGAVVEQQYVMTSTNNLILLLGEVLQSLQKSAAEQMQGMQQCQKPGSKGKGKPSMSQISQMQQSLKQQMEQMIKQMQSGNMPGKMMQKELSDMLMQQQMMQQLLNSLMKDGNFSPEGMQQLKEIQKMMEKTEQDIVNQNVTQQTILRQQQILTRMLESEKALKERDIDKKRESTEGKDNFSNAKEMFKKENQEEIIYEDLLKQTNLKFKSYYLKIFNEYLHNINQN